MPLPTKITDLIPALGLIPHPEGGFFVETFRSGATPMSTMGQTGIDKGSDRFKSTVVTTDGRAGNRPDEDLTRNCITSIYWVPTVNSTRLYLAYNYSDHVHYYQGGRPFRYSLFDPETKEVTHVTLGPELHLGQTPQVCVKGGLWKCGVLMTDDDDDNEYEYCLIGEAVGPGFDFHDFNWVTEDQVRKLMTGCSKNNMDHFLTFVYKEAVQIKTEQRTVENAAEYYEEGDAKRQRAKERS